METSKLITALTDFANGKNVETFGGHKNAINHDTTWKRLKRIWNDGNGLIDFAIMDKDVLIINSMPCTKKEIKDIEANLKVPFEVVFYGYPDYYSKGLIDMRKK